MIKKMKSEQTKDKSGNDRVRRGSVMSRCYVRTDDLTETSEPNNYTGQLSSHCKLCPV